MYLQQLLNNKTFFIVLFAWILSCLIKGAIVFARDKKIDWTRFAGSGGMPSSHSTLVTSLATCVGLHNGLDSIEFVICLALAFVVMYDASGVRRAAGKHASVINMIVDVLAETSEIKKEEKLKELLGHKPAEVVAGAILGFLFVIVANIFISI